MNYKFCTNCGIELLYIDAVCHNCPTIQDIKQSDLPTVSFQLSSPTVDHHTNASTVSFQHEKPVKTINVRLRQVAEKFSIKTAYQFQKFTGFSPAMSYSIWNNNGKTISLNTLNTLCNLFDCTPNDILGFSADEI